MFILAFIPSRDEADNLSIWACNFLKTNCNLGSLRSSLLLLRYLVKLQNAQNKILWFVFSTAKSQGTMKKQAIGFFATLNYHLPVLFYNYPYLWGWGSFLACFAQFPIPNFLSVVGVIDHLYNPYKVLKTIFVKELWSPWKSVVSCEFRQYWTLLITGSELARPEVHFCKLNMFQQSFRRPKSCLS